MWEAMRGARGGWREDPAAASVRKGQDRMHSSGKVPQMERGGEVHLQAQGVSPTCLVLRSRAWGRHKELAGKARYQEAMCGCHNIFL